MLPQVEHRTSLSLRFPSQQNCQRDMCWVLRPGGRVCIVTQLGGCRGFFLGGGAREVSYSEDYWLGAGESLEAPKGGQSQTVGPKVAPAPRELFSRHALQSGCSSGPACSRRWSPCLQVPSPLNYLSQRGHPAPCQALHWVLANQLMPEPWVPLLEKRSRILPGTLSPCC